MRGAQFIAGGLIVAWFGSAGCANVARSSPRPGPDGGADVPGPADISPEAPAPMSDVPLSVDLTPIPQPDPGPAIMTCDEAKAKPGNAGCNFYAVPAVAAEVIKNGTFSDGTDCLVMFVVNPGKQPVKLKLYDGAAPVSLTQVARLPRGAGRSLTYAPFDEATGIPPGDVALLFLWDGFTGMRPGCPADITAAAKGPRAGGPGSGIGNAFRLTTERAVVSYQMHPYHAGNSFYTSATLLIPTEAWGKDHFVPAPSDTGMLGSFALAVASEADTTVSFIPRTATIGGTRVPPTNAGSTVRVKLNAGEFVRFSTVLVDTGEGDLAGSPLTADKPVGVFGGSHCFYEAGTFNVIGRIRATPMTTCDGAHQQVPPISALGHQYAAVGYRERFPGYENHLWQIMGAVNGTQLTYEPYRPEGAPTTLNAGQIAKFAPRGYPTRDELKLRPSEPFIVRSQDAQHPFHLAALMTGCMIAPLQGYDKTDGSLGTPCNECPGDPEFVNVVPIGQYMSAYTFFTDPTYPDTSFVVVRQKNAVGQFAAVKLECATAGLSGWKPLGDLEYTHVDLTTGYFDKAIPTCDNGRHYISSTAPFAVTVWGVGRFIKDRGPVRPDPIREGSGFTSYAYPAGTAILRLNDVPPPIIVP